MSPREQFMVAAMQSTPLLGWLTERASHQDMKMDRQPLRIRAEPPEFDPYVSGARMFLPMIHWVNPSHNQDMFTSPDRIPINAMSMDHRRALANGTVMFHWIPRQNMKW